MTPGRTSYPTTGSFGLPDLDDLDPMMDLSSGKESAIRPCVPVTLAKGHDALQGPDSSPLTEVACCARLHFSRRIGECCAAEFRSNLCRIGLREAELLSSPHLGTEGSQTRSFRVRLDVSVQLLGDRNERLPHPHLFE